MDPDRGAGAARKHGGAGPALTHSWAGLQAVMSERLRESARLVADLPATAADGPRSRITSLRAGRLLLTTRWDPNAVRPGPS